MAQLDDKGKIEPFDLVLTCMAWFILNYSAWMCFISYAFQHNLDVAAIFMASGSLFGALFCIDMYFYNKNGDILEKPISEIIA